jgi:hypothetical protein
VEGIEYEAIHKPGLESEKIFVIHKQRRTSHTNAPDKLAVYYILESGECWFSVAVTFGRKLDLLCFCRRDFSVARLENVV